MASSVLLEARQRFHTNICTEILGYRSGTDVLSVADGSQRSSVDLAKRMAEKLVVPPSATPKAGQSVGDLFTLFVKEFLTESFQRLQHLRPGEWAYSVVPQHAKLALASYEQYEHLLQLKKALEADHTLATTLGGDYFVTPDVVVARQPVGDSAINIDPSAPFIVPEDRLARYTPLRAANWDEPKSILHASISCKWTMRSDRAQNARTEALNLIRHRKGNAPHIAFVTMEPLPSRLASIAMGTGDIDCAYHAALHELISAVEESGNQDQGEILEALVQGRRLRDISDLPFDLAV